MVEQNKMSALSYKGLYSCPVCRQGEISCLPLMEAFACNFCRHIFTADLEKQWIQLADSSQPLSWRWNGSKWVATYRSHVDMTWEIWLVAIALVLLPPSLIWLGYHIFPPETGSKGYWFPPLWTLLSFLSHLAFVSWLIVEYYQLPIYVSLRVRLRQLLGRP
ncbi:MAG: hypothetical protein GDA56_18175 [Hormoscilla sp. GM7CHS1pb]|nr:hypothetical protein [Hormoscilla sp. GM7CHS1pb]